MNSLFLKIRSKYHKILSRRMHRRMVSIKSPVPIISFTFDDAPKSAFEIGGKILRAHNIKATFFVSLGLLDAKTEVGIIASEEDLRIAISDGNELGCHTFNHLYAWETTTQEFIKSVERNKQALNSLFPGRDFQTFAYPIGNPRPGIKAKLKEYFKCCRGGGQAINVGMVDLNLISAYFIDKRNNANIQEIQKIIDYNKLCNGWLILATHDIAENHSPYGCTAKYFEEVVQYAANSGALFLPVGKACERLGRNDAINEARKLKISTINSKIS